jgi:hypothetical protein
LDFGIDLSGENSTLGPLYVSDIGVVPEPTSLGVIALGGLGLLARRRGRKSGSIQ